ncbi:hypothetical protein GC176_10920 [bacterium]|nr:hypothetical protein [bacterium]
MTTSIRWLCVAQTFVSVSLISGLNSPLNAAEETRSVAADVGLKVVAIEQRDGGEIAYRVTSPWQHDETIIRVLLPDGVTPDERLRVLLVLPVEAGEGTRWGDGFNEVRLSGLQNVHRLICVMPTFSDLPWYADHPTDPRIRQESYLLNGVVPWVDESFPTIAAREGRLLVGFSKSGWGAFSLLLRHPDVFDRAAAWDAPLMMDTPGRYGSGPIFGTPENFATYQLSKLLAACAEPLRANTHPRLIHLGFGNFRSEHSGFETLLNNQQIPHIYADGPQRPHAWNSGWLPDAISLLTAKKFSSK